MNWSGGGKKRYRPRLGLNITKSLFRHQNRIPLVDDRYVQEMISKSKLGKRMSDANIYETPQRLNSNIAAEGAKSPSTDEESPASMFGDIPVGTPSQPSQYQLVEYACPSDDGDVVSQKSKESDTSCIMLKSQPPQAINLHEIPESTSSPQTGQESGLFEGDGLSAYCSPPKDFETCSMKVSRYILQHTTAAYPNVVAHTSRSWDNTLRSENICTPVRKQVRFGGVNVDSTPGEGNEEYPREIHNSYPKTPILKKVTNAEKPMIEASIGKSSNSFNETSDSQSATQESVAEMDQSTFEPCLNACFFQAPNSESVNGKAEVKKRKHRLLKTKKKLLFKKIIIKEKVIHKAYKVVKLRDAAIQTTQL